MKPQKVVVQWAQSEDLSQTFLFSLLIHTTLVLFFLLKAALVPSENLLIRNAIRVDVVDLPDKIQPPAPTPSVQAPPKVEMTPHKIPTPEKAKPSKTADNKALQKNAIERIKALQAIDKLKQEVNEPPKQQSFKGVALSEGNALTGLDKIEYDRYFDELEHVIRENWNLPQWLANAPLKAQAKVKISEDGHITRQLITSSGNEVFDTSVLEAIDRAGPNLPPPPSRLRGLLAIKGVIFNFPE